MHCTAHNYRLRFYFQEYLLQVVTIPRILTQQQSHCVQGCFIKLSEPWKVNCRACASLPSLITRFTPAKHTEQWWSKEWNRLPPLPAASAVLFTANCTAHTWPCSDSTPGAAGAESQSCRGRDWGDSVGMMWCWLHTLARDWIWSGCGAQGLLPSKASTTVPGIEGQTLAWEAGDPILLLKVASLHTKWAYYEYYWER